VFQDSLSFLELVFRDLASGEALLQDRARIGTVRGSPVIGPHPSVAEWWLDIDPPIMPEPPIALSICSCIASHRARSAAGI